MAGNRVNLDGLIRREDFEGGTEPQRPGEFKQIRAAEVETGMGLSSLFRKPDFQRETASWKPDQIIEFIKAFINEDFVPSIILWRSRTNMNFVIDGAHRLSSLMAWVNDDYGAGTLSENFWGGKDLIPPDVKRIAKTTKDRVDEEIGPYQKIKTALSDTDSLVRYQETAAVLPHCHIRVEWLPQSDAGKAERSFFKINEQGVELSETEKTLLHSRKCPNSVAARAVAQRGTGHPHWKKFDQPKREEIQKLASDLHDRLFLPLRTGGTGQNRDIPIAGDAAASGSLAMLLNLVNITNDIPYSAPDSKEEAGGLLPPDDDGSATITLLKRTSRVATRMTQRIGDGSGEIDTGMMRCLDLHPQIYFNSELDHHQPSSFLAVSSLVSKLDRDSNFHRFTLVRNEFENFLLEHRDFIQQLGRRKRGGLEGVFLVTKYFEFVIDKLLSRQAFSEVIQALQASEDFSFLKLQIAPPEVEEAEEVIPKKVNKKGFPKPLRGKAFVDFVISSSAICCVCEARIPDRGISHDHKEKRELGGSNTMSNRANSHHYCNSARDQLDPLFARWRAQP